MKECKEYCIDNFNWWYKSFCAYEFLFDKKNLEDIIDELTKDKCLSDGLKLILINLYCYDQFDNIKNAKRRISCVIKQEEIELFDSLSLAYILDFQYKYENILSIDKCFEMFSYDMSLDEVIKRIHFIEIKIKENYDNISIANSIPESINQVYLERVINYTVESLISGFKITGENAFSSVKNEAKQNIKTFDEIFDEFVIHKKLKQKI